MKKAEFKKRINKCELMLKDDVSFIFSEDEPCRRGICATLHKLIGVRGVNTFSYLFSPEDSKDYWESYWVGSIKVLDDPNNEILELRILFLRMFEAYCVEFGLYKKF